MLGDLEVDPVDLSLLPATSQVVGGRLKIGGVDVLDAAREFGTPLFIYDEQELIGKFDSAYKMFGDGVAYAGKAFLCQVIARLAYSRGLSIDVSTLGEYHCCTRAGVSPDHLVVHGNNKTLAEIETAIREKAQWIVLDSFDEMRMVSGVARDLGIRPNVLVRINPGVEVHTHKYVATGNRASKFGFPSWTDDAARAIEFALEDGALNFMGIHMHVGSHVLSIDTFLSALGTALDLIRLHQPDVFVVGGGLGARYLNSDTCPTLEEWASAILSWCREHGITSRVLAEPGRALVASAAVTLYSVGSISTKGDFTFVSVDGGMSDNPRPILYGSGYEVMDVARPLAVRDRLVQLVGRHCESGDTLVPNGYLPSGMSVGDIVCTPVTGAYGYSMASNYNMTLRPAVIFVKDGKARVVIRRETVEDVLRTDMG